MICVKKFKRIINSNQINVNQVMLKQSSNLLALEDRDDRDQEEVNDKLLKNDHHDDQQKHLICGREMELSSVEVVFSNAILKQSLDILTFSINRLEELIIDSLTYIFKCSDNQVCNHELWIELWVRRVEFFRTFE
jgi:hypothetical protein